MIEINLVPDVKQELIRAQRMRATVISSSIIASIVAAGVVVALLVYVFGVQAVRSKLVGDEITKQYQTLSQVPDLNKTLTIQKQLATISTLNQSKKIDSRIFDVVAAVVPPAPNEVKLSQITVNAADSIITLQGQTRAYDSMEVFKKTLDSAEVQYNQDGETQRIKLTDQLDAGEVSYGEDSSNQKVLMFTISFTYPEELFSPAVKGMTIKLNANGNVTDSYLGVPRSIFTEPAKGVDE